MQLLKRTFRNRTVETHRFSKIDPARKNCHLARMLRLIAAALFAVIFLSSCGLINRTLQVPGRTIKSLGRTVGF